MRGILPVMLALALLPVSGAGAAGIDEVNEKWRTPFDLYLTPREAWEMKSAEPYRVLLIDVRTRAEVKYIGMAGAVDANIPWRLLRDDYAWSEQSATYRTRVNPDFIAAIDTLLGQRQLDRDTPIILMCQSGSRAPAAARALHQEGFGAVYTQYQGFEGIKATEGEALGKRVVNGWKNAGLPWSYRLDAARMYFNFAPR